MMPSDAFGPARVGPRNVFRLCETIALCFGKVFGEDQVLEYYGIKSGNGGSDMKSRFEKVPLNTFDLLTINVLK